MEPRKSTKQLNFTTHAFENTCNTNGGSETKPAKPKVIIDILALFPEEEEITESSKERSHQYFICISNINNHETNKIFSNITGCLPIMSISGNQYILVIYDYDSNTILVEPLKNCTEG
eukprot:9830305-Ditylum_brightwellii.AAC.1